MQSGNRYLELLAAVADEGAVVAVVDLAAGFPDLVPAATAWRYRPRLTIHLLRQGPRCAAT